MGLVPATLFRFKLFSILLNSTMFLKLQNIHYKIDLSLITFGRIKYTDNDNFMVIGQNFQYYNQSNFP